MKDIFTDITPKDAIELAKRSSWIHKDEYYEQYKYLGKKFEYNGFKLVTKEYQKKEWKTDFHVVLIKSDKNHKKEHGQLDRFFIINIQFRNVFKLFNIEDKNKSIEVDIFHDDLFMMHKYLIENKYELPHPSKR